MPVLVTTQKLAEEQLTDEELREILTSGSTTLQLRKLRIDNTDIVVYCDVTGEDMRPATVTKAHLRSNTFVIAPQWPCNQKIDYETLRVA